MIRSSHVFLLDDKGGKIGEMEKNDAIQKAKSEKKDLVEISIVKGKDLSICKIIDYGKHLYNLKKSKKEDTNTNKDKGKLKVLRLGYNTDDGDFDLKVQKARKFLDKGIKVRVALQFKGRENQYKNIGMQKVRDFATALEDISTASENVSLRGNRANITLISKK